MFRSIAASPNQARFGLLLCLGGVAFLGRSAAGDLPRPEPGDYTVRNAPAPFPDHASAYQVANLEQGIATYFTELGIRVVPIGEDAPAWQLDLAPTGYGTAGSLQPPGTARLSASDNHVLFKRKDILELYVNDSRGIEHRFIVLAPPPGIAQAVRSLLQLELSLGGGLEAKQTESRSIEFYLEGQSVLRYGDLIATDNQGERLPAELELAADRSKLMLVVDAAGSRYPVSVELVLSSEKAASEQGAAPGSTSGAAPTNDTCAGAITMPGGGPFPYSTTAVDVTDATESPGDPTSCVGSHSRNIWYTFTPNTTGNYTISTCPNQAPGTTLPDTILAIYTSTGGCAGPFNEITCNDDDPCCAAAKLASTFTTYLTAGTTYYIVAWKYGTSAPSAGAASVQIRVALDPSPAPPAPTNDVCSTAEAIPAAGPFPYTTALTSDITSANTTGDPTSASCGYTNRSRSIWYTFTPTVSTTYTFSSCADAPTGSTVDENLMAVYTSTGGCAGPFTQVAGACDGDSCVNEDLQGVVAVPLTAGTTYYILLWQNQVSTCTPQVGNTAEQLRVTKTPPPANDQCGGAEVIPDGPYPVLTAVTSDISGATTTGDPPSVSCASASRSRSVWYKFTPGTTAYYTISSCADAPTGTTVDDTAIAIYTSTGACAGPFTEIPSSACSGGCDSGGCVTEDLQGVVTTQLNAGTTYYIVVWKNSSTTPTVGNTAIQLRVVRQAAPANDMCSGAEIIPGAGPFPYLTSTTPDISFATCAGDPPAPSCQPDVSRSIWYSFTPAASGCYSISSCADAPTASTVDDNVLTLYTSSGGCAGPFTEVTTTSCGNGCDDDSCSVGDRQAVLTVSLNAGTKYYIVERDYDSAAPTAGNTAVQLRVSQILPPANDQCAAATPLALNVPVTGTINPVTANDYQLSGSACFTGVGQTPSTASGRDVVYSFTPSSTGNYSFRATDYPTS
ncbi:MAG: hypothetical protein DMF49_04825, partial [Acidobacteria bacterium]